jgi:hypothetical protein
MMVYYLDDTLPDAAAILSLFGGAEAPVKHELSDNSHGANDKRFTELSVLTEPVARNRSVAI